MTLLQDTAGQERYHSLAPMYYRGAQAAIVVYDIQNQDSFVRAQTWVKELQRQVSPPLNTIILWSLFNFWFWFQGITEYCYRACWQ